MELLAYSISVAGIMFTRVFVTYPAARGAQLMKSITDDNRYQYYKVPVDIYLSTDIDYR